MNDDLYELILQESQLLDEGKLDDWLTLWADDATYWVPIDEGANPMMESSVIFDNRERLAMRVEQLMREDRVAQSPPSHTLRMISNFLVRNRDEASATVSYALMLTEMRAGDWRQRGLGDVRLFPAHCSADFRKVGSAWKFHQKKIVLLNRHRPLDGLSFII